MPASRPRTCSRAPSSRAGEACCSSSWWAGLPSSSTYALLGGLIGATWVISGTHAIRWHEVGTRVALPAL
ncbi:MAG: Phosphate transporter family, partial [Gaiellales bacterium]|nr:Phosphate transporter family [Gaiellales bacterium]